MSVCVDVYDKTPGHSQHGDKETLRLCVSEFSVKNKLLLPLRTAVITTVASKATTTPRSALGFVQGLGNTQHFISFLHFICVSLLLLPRFIF